MSDVLVFVEFEEQQVELLPARTVLSLLGVVTDLLDAVAGSSDGSGGDNGGGGDHGSSGGIDETAGGSGGQNVVAGDVKGENYQTSTGGQAVPITGPGGTSSD